MVGSCFDIVYVFCPCWGAGFEICIDREWTKAVIGNKATTAHSIVGTWTYQAPECQFESDQLLAKAGGEIAAKEVEEKLQTIYDKIGLAGIKYIFKEDGTYHIYWKNVR